MEQFLNLDEDFDKMNNITLKKLASELKYRLVDEKMSENEIIKVLEQTPKLAEVILPATTNLFMEAVSYNKMKVVEKLISLNSDIHLCCRPSAIRGNALNLAKTPEMADYLLNTLSHIKSKELLTKKKELRKILMA